MNNIEEIMKAYAKEIGLSTDNLIITDLIDSHRLLRFKAQQSQAERLREMQKARDFATDQARKFVLEHEYVSVERLRTMTLGEISALIQEWI